MATADLYIEILQEKNNAMHLNYVAGNLLPRANTLKFLRHHMGVLVWFLLSHRGTLMKAGRVGTLAVCKNDGEFVEILFAMLNNLENLDGQGDLADLIDLCDGSKLSVELYYLDPTEGSDTDNYIYDYTYDFSFFELKKVMGAYPSDFTNHGLAAILTKLIEYDFDENPDFYEPFLDSPEISLARVCLTLTFEEGK
jgi:hypothetical protein